jgi:hypothetical protein
MKQLPFFVSALCVAQLLLTPAAGYASTVRAFALPAGFTVAPERETRAIGIAPDGSLVARIESTDKTFRTRAVRWDANGVRSIFAPL